MTHADGYQQRIESLSLNQRKALAQLIESHATKPVSKRGDRLVAFLDMV